MDVGAHLHAFGNRPASRDGGEMESSVPLLKLYPLGHE